MENHSDAKWQLRTRLFISKDTNNIISQKLENLLEKIENSLHEKRKKISKLVDELQLRIIKIAHELTKKPVLAFTIEEDSDFDKMENLFIVNYIVDFSSYGVEEYINRINNKSK
jgi:hypothetical protein